MKAKALLILTLFAILELHVSAQNLDLDFLKHCLVYSETEVAQKLATKNFKLVSKAYKNMGDKLINKSDYYSNKNESIALEGTDEVAIFLNTKRSKKSVFVTFSQNMAFNNFNSLEEEIKKNFKKEGALQSTKYDSTILKFSLDKTIYYLFKEENTYYIIVSNYNLEEVYFNDKSE